MQSESVSLRQLRYHEEEPVSRVASRHCAIWNPDIGLLGAWDTDNIQTVQANEISATCVTDRLLHWAYLHQVSYTVCQGSNKYQQDP